MTSVNAPEIVPSGIRVGQGWLNPMRAPYNARGDGVTDDTGALYRCMNDADKLQMGMDCPDGVFVYSDALPLPSGIPFKGAGEGRTVFLAKPGAVIPKFLSLQATNPFYVKKHLSGFTIDGNYLNGAQVQYPIYLEDNSTQDTIDLVEIRNCQNGGGVPGGSWAIGNADHCYNLRCSRLNLHTNDNGPWLKGHAANASFVQSILAGNQRVQIKFGDGTLAMSNFGLFGCDIEPPAAPQQGAFPCMQVSSVAGPIHLSGCHFETSSLDIPIIQFVDSIAAVNRVMLAGCSANGGGIAHFAFNALVATAWAYVTLEGSSIANFLTDAFDRSLGHWFTSIRNSNINGVLVADQPGGMDTSVPAGFFSCTGVPANGTGNDGDFCFRRDGVAGSRVYFHTAGAWVAIL